jgi:hypothetical protein
MFTPAVLVGIVLVLLGSRMARADDLDPDQIKAILRTTTDSENSFIDRTVAMVQAGTLPRPLFTSTLIWARKKPRHQYQYFRQALTVRAAQVGIKL